MTILLLDTTVLIDLSRGYTQAAEFIDNRHESGFLLAISVVSAMELVVGCRNKTEVTQAEKLIGDFSLLQMTPAISTQAYDWLLSYSKSHGLLIPDALIAATALIHEMELATDNVRDFKMLPGLRVRKPY
jgi:predicted nucleic acid-binding protein